MWHLIDRFAEKYDGATSDKDRPAAGDQFPGWPFEISQTDNDGRRFPYLRPTLKLNKENRVVKVFSSSGELISALRLKGERAPVRGS